MRDAAPEQTRPEAALALAKAGLPVFPCGDDKRPRLKWRDAATTDAATVATWWRQWPNALPAVPMGTASGLFAVDADVDRETGEETGKATLKALVPDIGRHCFRARTPSGGAHFFYRWAKGLPRNSVKGLAGVDIRSEGGYVIAWWPETLIAAHQAADLEAPPSAILAALADAKAKPAGGLAVPGLRAKADDPATAWAERALTDEIAALIAATKGGRNDSVNRCAFNLGQIVGGGHLDRARAEAAIWNAAMANGVAIEEPEPTRRIMHSRLDSGMAQPRRPKDAPPSGAALRLSGGRWAGSGRRGRR